MKIGIIVAMSSELECIRLLIRNVQTDCREHDTFYRGSVGRHEIILTQSGIGKVNAALTAQTLISNYTPNSILNTGVAGGVDASVHIFDVVIGKETTYHDAWFGEGNVIGQIQGLPARFPADPQLLHKVEAAVAGEHIHSGLICCGDSFISDKKELGAIKKNFPECLAVDMESAAIAQTCYRYNTPFICMRIISDTPGVDNHMAQYNSFWEKAPEKSFVILRQILEQL
ncbi:MAG: 5'-methylthioadenosine/adenosylhomocysteine nucleosidase [Porphyromonadaceae bacterium]|nr:5'-methylthioadenosine/adenosylhomocysteine nucleosidase [Porphyromonadaceae bacterium]